MFSRVLLLPALVCVFLASNLPGTVSGAEPTRPFTLLRRDGPSVFLDYFPSGSGVSILHASGDLLQLRGTNASLFAVPAGLAPITFDITSFVGGDHGFFAVTEFPGQTLADYGDPEPEFTEPPRAYYIESLVEIDTLVSGQPITISFRLLDGATMLPVTFSGSVRLGLVTIDGNPVGFPYTLSPETLPLVAGVVNGTVTITSAGDLSAAHLAVIELLPAAPALAPGKSAAVLPQVKMTPGSENRGDTLTHNS